MRKRLLDETVSFLGEKERENVDCLLGFFPSAGGTSLTRGREKERLGGSRRLDRTRTHPVLVGLRIFSRRGETTRKDKDGKL